MHLKTGFANFEGGINSRIVLWGIFEIYPQYFDKRKTTLFICIKCSQNMVKKVQIASSLFRALNQNQNGGSEYVTLSGSFTNIISVFFSLSGLHFFSTQILRVLHQIYNFFNWNVQFSYFNAQLAPLKWTTFAINLRFLHIFSTEVVCSVSDKYQVFSLIPFQETICWILLDTLQEFLRVKTPLMKTCINCTL